MNSIQRVLRHARKTSPFLWPLWLLFPLTRPVPPGLWIANFAFQRVLGINAGVSWMVNFTSQVTGRIEIGENVWKSFALSGHCYVQGVNGVRIGRDTIFAPGVKIVSSNHVLGDLGSHEAGAGVEIGERCWLGANCVVLPGVSLGDGVIVGAGAVVTKSFPSGSVLAGVPARRIR